MHDMFGIGPVCKDAIAGFRDLHRDERGDDNATKLLYFGLVAVPLLLLLMAFKDKIVNWFKDQTELLFKDGGSEPTFP